MLLFYQSAQQQYFECNDTLKQQSQNWNHTYWDELYFLCECISIKLFLKTVRHS